MPIITLSKNQRLCPLPALFRGGLGEEFGQSSVHSNHKRLEFVSGMIPELSGTCFFCKWVDIICRLLSTTVQKHPKATFFRSSPSTSRTRRQLDDHGCHHDEFATQLGDLFLLTLQNCLDLYNIKPCKPIRFEGNLIVRHTKNLLSMVHGVNEHQTKELQHDLTGLYHAKTLG